MTSLITTTGTTNHHFGTAPIMNLPNVLHFLQSEWRKFETERDAWLIERAEFQSKLIVLEGERRGLENVTMDLLQRIKLLEQGLRQERLKYLQTSGASSIGTNNSSTLSALSNEDIDNSQDTVSTSSYPPNSFTNRDRQSVSQRTRQDSLRSRDILKAYLNEVSSLCLTNTLGQDDGNHANLDVSFMNNTVSTIGLQNCKEDVSFPTQVPTNQVLFSSSQNHLPLNLSLNTSIERPSSLLANFQAPNVRMKRESKNIIQHHSKDQIQQVPITRRVKHTLRHHLDAVRMVDVHPLKSILASASMDHTIKLWQIGQKRRDIEPYMTLRAHRAPILSVAFDIDSGVLFSGSADANLFAWKLPKECTAYAPPDRKLLLANFKGHTNAIWDLKVHTIHSILASCSSDGTVRLWDTQLAKTAITRHTIQTNGTPTSISFVSSDPNRLLVSLTDGQVLIFDIETSKIVNSFNSNKQVTINRVVVHPTMSLATTVCNDGSVQFIDWSSGALIHHFESAHSAAATSACICPGGLVVATGGHDCLARVWDIGMRACITENREHTSRRCNNEGIWSVCFGSGLLGQSVDFKNSSSGAALVSAGSDGIVKVYDG